MTLKDYYQAQTGYFWLWEEEGNVLSISGGMTIAYRLQVADILTMLAENGLPPFGSFLLAMIATGDTTGDPLSKVAAIIDSHRQPIRHELDQHIDDAFAFLRLLRLIPREYTAGRRRQILLTTIFARSHNRINIATSIGIAKGLRDISSGVWHLKQKAFSSRLLEKDMKVLALLSQKFPTTHSIVEAMGELPHIDEADLILPDPVVPDETKHKDFVDELMGNPQTFHTAALIRPIWAGFNIPIFNAHPSEQPLGGVSDISNKGDFHQLLISEFANDDLIFMNRIANNEALYLHRDRPPVKDDVHRTILIDVSLKSWGAPKILAYAFWLAIARHPKSISKVAAYAVGSQYTPLSAASMGGIIDGLQIVDASLHPANGLAAFLKANQQDKQLEIFYISPADTIRHPAVQKLLSDYAPLFKYIITTNPAGEITCYRRNSHTQKHLQTIRLPLKKLWTKGASRSVGTDPVPVFTAAPKEFPPMLLESPMKITKMIPFDTEIYMIANRCLYRRGSSEYKSATKGWQLILRNIPANGIYEVGRSKDDHMLFLSYDPQSKGLTITDLHTLQQATTTFEPWSGKAFREFLFTDSRRFVWLHRSPDVYEFETDFETGVIKSEKRLQTGSLFSNTYPERKKEIENLPAISYRRDLLKNITRIYINENDCLIFNRHRLLRNDSWVGFSGVADYGVVAEATKGRDPNIFTFKDGSKIVIDGSGYITLTSSIPDSEEVFIVPVLGTAVGMATAKQFAGDDYFYNPEIGAVSVSLESVSGNRIEAIKALKRYYIEMGLNDAKYLIDTIPQKIPGKISYWQATKMIEELKNLGCSAKIAAVGQEPQQIVSAGLFYQQNISKFIVPIISAARS